MPSLVIDSSLSASWCFPDEQAEYANAILKAMSGPLIAKEFLQLIQGLPIRLADPFPTKVSSAWPIAAVLRSMTRPTSIWQLTNACRLPVSITLCVRRPSMQESLCSDHSSRRN